MVLLMACPPIEKAGEWNKKAEAGNPVLSLSVEGCGWIQVVFRRERRS